MNAGSTFSLTPARRTHLQIFQIKIFGYRIRAVSGKMTRRQTQNRWDYYSKILYDVSALILNVLRSPPPPLDFSDYPVAVDRRGRNRPSFQQITPVGFASLLFGISLALMLCGSVTFFLGFVLMPWVLGLVIILYFVGVVSSISMIGRAIWCYIQPRLHLEKILPHRSSYRKGSRLLDIVPMYLTAVALMPASWNSSFDSLLLW